MRSDEKFQIEKSNKQPSVDEQTITEENNHIRKYPKRERNVLLYLKDYVTKAQDENDLVLIDIDYCYKVTSNVPQTNWETSNSPKAHSWKSKNQPMATLLTCEAEHMALAKATQNGLYFTQLSNEMDLLSVYALVKVFGNKQGTLSLSKDSIHPHKTPLFSETL